ncbi:hypothetical protein MNBD_GAMMA21-1302 [hydrothermal vent metagenome]|uniref:Uncharacterized protein n=1 Tax=hydrothermal vent metagenome TaxID=652676 RepID=A0A3B0ZXW9_9ZZZZ
MNNETVKKVHWSFWLIGAIALLWNVMGSLNFFMQMNADIVAGLPETHRAIIEGRPIWATAGFALAVFGGALGGLLLLFRKSIAIHLFIASLLGALVTMIHTINIARSTIDFSSGEIAIMILSPLVVGVLLIWYSIFAKGRGWVR